MDNIKDKIIKDGSPYPYNMSNSIYDVFLAISKVDYYINNRPDLPNPDTASLWFVSYQRQRLLQTDRLAPLLSMLILADQKIIHSLTPFPTQEDKNTIHHNIGKIQSALLSITEPDSTDWHKIKAISPTINKYTPSTVNN